MRGLKRIIALLLLLLVFAVGIGFLLPSSFRVERAIAVDASAEKVYRLIADPREWKKWSAWNRRDPAMQIEYGGPASGKGAQWSWNSKSEGSGSMEFTEAIENAGMPGSRI